MRCVVQRVASASVSVDGAIVGRIDRGLLVFIGVAKDDAPADVEYVASKIRDLRVFEDERGRMNRSVTEIGGSVLLVSEFTLLGDARKGRRPAFDEAAPTEHARQIYEALVARVQDLNLAVATGRFQADMDVSLLNDGPVTILLDSRRLF
jgi:D-aminoacyl-tRNA deacylase